MNKRLEEILKRNTEFEKESPYNFCDRWCERCVSEKQIRCKIFQDELEQKMTCIAHGKEERDPEITEAVMKRQFEEAGEKLEEFPEEHDIDLDEADDPEMGNLRERIESVQNHPLPVTAEEYRKRAHEFLERAFYHQRAISRELAYDFETIAWYHTLLVVKLNRGLDGFYEPARDPVRDESQISDGVCDAVAQLEICKKAADASVRALRKLSVRLPSSRAQIRELLALLHNLHSRIAALEESV